MFGKSNKQQLTQVHATTIGCFICLFSHLVLSSLIHSLTHDLSFPAGVRTYPKMSSGLLLALLLELFVVTAELAELLLEALELLLLTTLSMEVALLGGAEPVRSAGLE